MPLIVNRTLPGSKTTFHALVMEGDDPDIDDQEHYMREIADSNVDKFLESYVEFKDAEFEYFYIPPYDVLKY